MDHLIFEETQSCLYQSNDGRLVFDHSIGPVNTFVVLLDGVEVFATHYRFAVDVYIAGYDAAAANIAGTYFGEGSFAAQQAVDANRYCVVCEAILRSDEEDRCAVHGKGVEDEALGQEALREMGVVDPDAEDEALLERVYGQTREEPCKYGHFDCATVEGGSCANEEYAQGSTE